MIISDREGRHSQARDADLRWRVPLDQKERLVQRDISDRHLVEGTYVPCVPIPSDGRPVDHTTTGNTGDMHASSWTGCYLVAAAFRYGWAVEHGSGDDVESALSLGETLVEGINILTHVSGIPGLLARKVVHGHGPAVEERVDNNSRNEWHQGVGPYRHLRFRGHPSHHNYHHVLRGLAYWYHFLLKENPDPSGRIRGQLEKVRRIVTEIMEFGYRANDFTLMTVDGRESARLIYGVTKGQPCTTGLMATNCLKFAHWITGDAWYQDKYREWVDWFGYRNVGDWPAEKWQAYYGRTHVPDHDDTEHTLASLWLVHQLEEDPGLKEFYRKAVASIFESKRKEKRSPFNYYYASVTGDLQGADLPGALETLQLYPSVTLTYPLMNSTRNDVGPRPQRRKGEPRGETILPFNDQPLDNSYDWKGDPYVLDRWLARPITSIALSDEDPEVWYLADSGGQLYRSLDGGRTFAVADFHQGARVHDVTFAGERSRIALLATDRGVFRTDTGGYMDSWQHVDLDGEGSPASSVVCDPVNPNVVWAVTGEGIYRSVDLGMEEVGKAWESTTGPMPRAAKAVPGQERQVVYALAAARLPLLYAALGGRLYRRAPRDPDWIMSPVDVEDYHIIPSYRSIHASPHDPYALILLLRLNVWGREMPLTLRTTDGGESLKVVGWQLPASRPGSEGSGLEEVALSSVAYDQSDSSIIYGSSPRGFHRSLDGGTTWELSNEGLRIQYAYRVFAPRQDPARILLSTPAGLQVSTDRGETWGSPVLVLNGPGVDRVERGGLGYLAAYWPGRYFGLITDRQASAAADAW